MKTVEYTPDNVINWTDKYFHQSAFDSPINYPSPKIILFLERFKKPRQVKLYRGMNKYNRNTRGVVSWTYDKQVAKRYAQETGGKILEKIFSDHQILLDTTVLTETQKLALGYDHRFDDKEVLILEI